MFDSPWPRNSRLPSMCWPERAATALAIEIDWLSATIVSAKAMPIRSGSEAQVEHRRDVKRGQIRRDRPDDRDPLRAERPPAVDGEREHGCEQQAEQHVRRRAAARSSARATRRW